MARDFIYPATTLAGQQIGLGPMQTAANNYTAQQARDAAMQLDAVKIAKQQIQASAYITTNRMPVDVNAITSMVMPLSALIDLWQARHGDQWISDDIRIPDAKQSESLFWEYAFRRLRSAGLFEQVDAFYRLKENYLANN